MLNYFETFEELRYLFLTEFRPPRYPANLSLKNSASDHKVVVCTEIIDIRRQGM